MGISPSYCNYSTVRSMRQFSKPSPQLCTNEVIYSVNVLRPHKDQQFRVSDFSLPTLHLQVTKPVKIMCMLQVLHHGESRSKPWGFVEIITLISCTLHKHKAEGMIWRTKFIILSSDKDNMPLWDYKFKGFTHTLLVNRQTHMNTDM